MYIHMHFHTHIFDSDNLSILIFHRIFLYNITVRTIVNNKIVIYIKQKHIPIRTNDCIIFHLHLVLFIISLFALTLWFRYVSVCMRCSNHNKNKIKVESRELIIKYTCNNSNRLIHVISLLNAGIPSTLYYILYLIQS